jgi:predicted transcriptional regulator
MPSSALSNDDALDYAAYVRRAIDAGMADSVAGRTIPVEQLRERFGLDSSARESMMSS